MRRLVIGFFAGVGLLTVLLIVAVIVVIIRLEPVTPALPGNMILSVDLNQGLADRPGEGGWLELIVGAKPTLRDFLDAIEAAGNDPRVKGLVARIGSDQFALAEAQQIRDAIAHFRAKGKFAIAFSDSFGEFGGGTRPYYLATAFDRIWLQPMGTVGLTGLYAETPYFKGTLDMFGIVAEFDHIGRYKTAANVLTNTRMTGPDREQVEALLASASAQVVAGIAQGRQLSPSAVRAAIDSGPLLPHEALQAKLVDDIGYRDQAVAAARRRAGENAKLVGISTYLEGAKRPYSAGARIALIYGSGLIVSGSSSDGPLSSSTEMGADDVVRAFRAAVHDPKVRAILFRINSPGGSVTASETIWRAVELAGKAGKPVIVSMGDVAGSGGYYIAAPAAKIVAEPATLTGSIGVLAGKLVVSGLLKKIGVTTDSAQFGANAAMASVTSPFSPLAEARVRALLDATYKGFKDHVAAGRHLSPDAVEAVAKGRVWTGEDAKAHGLVDALGGYGTALRLAKQAAGIAPKAPVELTLFPREKSPIELLYDRLTGRKRRASGLGAGALSRAIDAARPLLLRIDALIEPPGVLSMPPIGQPR